MQFFLKGWLYFSRARKSQGKKYRAREKCAFLARFCYTRFQKSRAFLAREKRRTNLAFLASFTLRFSRAVILPRKIVRDFLVYDSSAHESRFSFFSLVHLNFMDTSHICSIFSQKMVNRRQAAALLWVLRRRMARRLRRFYVRPAHDFPLTLRFRVFNTYYSSPDPEDLRLFLRLYSDEFDELLARLQPHLVRIRLSHRYPISNKVRLAIFLRYVMKSAMICYHHV